MRRLLPIPCHPDTPGALPLGGTWARFAHARLLREDDTIPAGALTGEERDTLCDPRPPFAGLTWERPRVMGILNVTPDSFSDGGRHLAAAAAVAAGHAMPADILDVGGESTRPGAAPVTPEEEAARVLPVIEGLAGRGGDRRVSIDTRNASTARAALAAGATIVNDVSALRHDVQMADAARGTPTVLMHSRGTPETMGGETRYDDLLAEVLDHLAERIAVARAAGIAEVVADPGIGFAKTAEQNLALIRALPAFHALGVPLLLGASRKRFIGVTAGDPEGAADRRDPGSLAVTLAGVRAGVHLHRVHDAEGTARGLRLWRAVQ